MLTFKPCTLIWTIIAALAVINSCAAEYSRFRVTYLSPGDQLSNTPALSDEDYRNDLQIYCYQGGEKSLSRSFETVELQLDIDSKEYTIFGGFTPEDVLENHVQQIPTYSFSLFQQRATHQRLGPFQQQCIGVETEEPYTVSLKQQRVSRRYLLQLIAGILLFVFSSTLSQSSKFYYASVLAMSVCSVYTLLKWFTSQSKQLMWTYDGIHFNRQTYIVWIFIMGTLSLMYCFRRGPPTNSKSKKVVELLFQCVSLVMIYYTSSYQEAAVALCITTILMHYIPRILGEKLPASCLSNFLPKQSVVSIKSESDC